MPLTHPSSVTVDVRKPHDPVAIRERTALRIVRACSGMSRRLLPELRNSSVSSLSPPRKILPLPSGMVAEERVGFSPKAARVKELTSSASRSHNYLFPDLPQH